MTWIQLCLNKVPGVINRLALMGHSVTQIYLAKTLKIVFTWTNHWQEYIDIWHGVSLGRRDSSLFNEVSRVMHDPATGALALHNYIREMLKQSSSQELLHQIRPYLAWIIPRTMRFKFVLLHSDI